MRHPGYAHMVPYLKPRNTVLESVKMESINQSCPSLPAEHRPSTILRHRTLFWAALSSPVQLVPCFFSSASVSRLQLLRGRPLFLLPCGFQVSAWRVVLDAGFLRVCPIQPHFLRRICLITGSCPAHRSPVAQRICHWTTDRKVPSSNPTGSKGIFQDRPLPRVSLQWGAHWGGLRPHSPGFIPPRDARCGIAQWLACSTPFRSSNPAGG